MMICKRAFMLVALLGLVSACGEGRKLESEDFGSKESTLGGHGVVVAGSSRAEQFRTPEGVAGAVARVTRNGQEICTATLIGRRQALTVRECTHETIDGTEYPKQGLAISFPQAPGWNFSGFTWRHTDGDWSVIFLDSAVPSSVVEKIPMFFVGDFYEALGTTLRDSEGVLVGYGASCPTCADDGVRRAGALGGPLSVCTVGDPNCQFSPTSASPYLAATLDPSVGAALFGFGDRGSPLFLWHEARQEYVLVGAQRHHDPSQQSVGWEVLGKVGNMHRWPWVRQFWVKDGGWVLVTDEMEPPEDALRLFGDDLDQDDVLDAADNCPPSLCIESFRHPGECANPDQTDSWGDGSGDICRSLSGPATEGCKPVPECVMVMMGDKEVCINYHTFNPRNSNVHVERAIDGASTLPDSCDPVPLLRVESKLELAPTTVPFTEYQVQPWLGSEGWSRVTEEEVDFRYCGCYDRQGELMEGFDCLDDGTCNAALAHWAQGKWEKDLTVIGPRVHEFHRATETTPAAVRWAWLDDAAQGKIPSHSRYSWGGLTTRGFFATTVLGEKWQSIRDRDTRGTLRSVLDFRSGDEIPSRDLPDIPSRICIPCLWFPPPFQASLELYGNPPRLPPSSWRERTLGSISLASGPVLLANYEGELHGLSDGHAGWDVKGALCPSLESDLLSSSGDIAYLLPVEPNSYLEDVGAPSSFLAISGFTTGEPEAQLVVESGGTFCAAGVPPATLSPDPRIRMSYAGSEGVLYMVGGGQGPTSSIVRWDVETGVQSVYAPLAHAPGTNVLSIAYDPTARTLYVLDVQDEIGLQRARLVSHDLVAQTSSLLWTLPYEGAFPWVALDVSEERRLILSAGNAQGFVSWMMDPVDGAFLGRMEGNGGLAALPAMGQHRLSLQTWSEETGLSTHVLGPWAFSPGDACTGL